MSLKSCKLSGLERYQDSDQGFLSHLFEAKAPIERAQKREPSI
jgi:hypothetical protein